MSNYIMARILAIVPTVLMLLFVVVALLRLLPGNAVDILLAEQAGGDKVSRDQLEARLGLDKSLPEQYIDYTLRVVRGDLGSSLWSRKPVTDIIVDKLGVTLELALLALIVGTVTGISIGVISAVAQNSPIDYVLRSFAVLGLSVPSFALATIIVVLPTLWWGWSPPLTYTPLGDGVWPHVSQFFTPAIILGLGVSTILMRLTRTTMLDVLRQDYIRTARSKGLTSRTVVLAHGLRNALIPVVSLLGIQVAFLISGTVLLEQIFGLPGIGRELLSSVSTRDYPVIQGITVVAGLWVIVTNLLVDISYGVLDPRIRVG